MNKKSHTILFFSLTCFLASAGIFSYTLYDVSQQGVRFEEAKRLIGEHSAKEAAYNSVQGLLLSTKDDREQIRNLFIEEKNTISFISEIEKNAKVTGVTLTTNELAIIPKSTDAGGLVTPAVLAIGFDFTGAEATVQQFISLLENIPYHKKTTELSFVKTDTNVWKANIKMKLILQYD